jgi:hypothetical protein
VSKEPGVGTGIALGRPKSETLFFRLRPHCVYNTDADIGRPPAPRLWNCTQSAAYTVAKSRQQQRLESDSVLHKCALTRNTLISDLKLRLYIPAQSAWRSEYRPGSDCVNYGTK